MSRGWSQKAVAWAGIGVFVVAGAWVCAVCEREWDPQGVVTCLEVQASEEHSFSLSRSGALTAPASVGLYIVASSWTHQSAAQVSSRTNVQQLCLSCPHVPPRLPLQCAGAWPQPDPSREGWCWC